ncbi:TIGR02269 family lipoprotein [Archangium violaceum]|uniref:SitA6 family polymorphic toxin lipoprotein n=1 Tax=Archangium violaceum TaxID=83451 RepID=UPI002B2C42FE|nr:TIGR02269 family lipoprotein [Archangium violaceum]
MRSPRTLCLLLVGFLFACATSSPAVQEGGPTLEPEVVASWEEGCEGERSLVLLCQEEECGFFHCREVVFGEEVLLASRGGGPIYIPGASPTPRGWRGRPIGWPRGTRPVLTFRFNRHFDPKPPQFALPPGRWVRHHLFPQAQELREWFHARGVPDIHQYTLLIPEHVHIRIHSSGPKGGLWNQAWRDFKDARPNASPEAIYRHAGELIFRFELTGPIVPYVRGGR